MAFKLGKETRGIKGPSHISGDTPVFRKKLENGVNAEAIIEADNFPAGQWIYGRWSACTLDDGAAFLYFADA